jgi:hypothetical protein
MNNNTVLCYNVCYNESLRWSYFFRWGLLIPQMATFFFFGYSCCNRKLWPFLLNVMCYWGLYFGLFIISQALDIERPFTGKCDTIYDRMAFPDPNMISLTTFIVIFLIMDIGYHRRKKKTNLTTWALLILGLLYYFFCVIWMQIFTFVQFILNIMLVLFILSIFIWISLGVIFPNLETMSNFLLFEWMGYKK